jgi:hypothetical protein
MIPEAAAQKPTYLKHYRRDETPSGKYQLIDVSKLDENGDIPVVFTTDHNNFVKSDSPAVVKGKWVHFVNDNYYANTQMEVDFIEWKMRTDPQFKVYEVVGGGTYQCGVWNCNAPPFADEQTLNNHRRAVHGV